VTSHLTEVIKEPPPRPPNQEVIIEDNYARELPDPLQVIWNIYDITKEGVVLSRPETILSQYDDEDP